MTNRYSSAWRSDNATGMWVISGDDLRFPQLHSFKRPTEKFKSKEAADKEIQKRVSGIRMDLSMAKSSLLDIDKKDDPQFYREMKKMVADLETDYARTKSWEAEPLP